MVFQIKTPPIGMLAWMRESLGGLNPAQRTSGNYRMLRDGEYSFPGSIHQLTIQDQMVRPGNIPMSNIIDNIDSFILRNIYACINTCLLTYTHIYATAINKKDAMNCEKNKRELHGKALKGKK